MKTWLIPAKTFLLGEYAAVAGRGAIVLTTQPCFEITLLENSGLQGIHPDSPAGRWWHQSGCSERWGLQFHDPYQQRGGMGASSAQFLGAYWASSWIHQQSCVEDELLNAYWQSAWQGKGLRPSGYDVIAQSLSGCVLINREEKRCDAFCWPFNDIGFVLVHTGQKLATHHHLLDTTIADEVEVLNGIVNQAHHAFLQKNSNLLVEAVNVYYETLLLHHRVAPYTQQVIAACRTLPGVLALKGCGAMGVDVVVLVVESQQVSAIQQHVKAFNLKPLATHFDLYHPSIFSGH